MSSILCPNCAESVAILSAAEAAARLGITMSALAEKARDRKIGIPIDARTRAYTEADVESLGRRKGR